MAELHHGLMGGDPNLQVSKERCDSFFDRWNLIPTWNLSFLAVPFFSFQDPIDLKKSGWLGPETCIVKGWACLKMAKNMAWS